MKIRHLAGVAVGITALAAPVVAHSADGDKATGGGQILIGSDAKRSTITFNAQQTGDAIRGQINVIDRSVGTGKQQQHLKGTVTCIEVTGNAAEIGGRLNDDRPFYLRVVDAGEPGAGNDMIEFDTAETNPNCDQEGNEDPRFEGALAKGNVQVHKQKPGRSSKSSSASSSSTATKSLTSLSLR